MLRFSSMLIALVLTAQVTQAGEIKSTSVASKLDNPTGICVQADTGHLFVATNKGVIRVEPKLKKTFVEIGGYETTDVYGKGPKYNIGPLGVTMIDSEHLAVGEGSDKDGSETVKIFRVRDTPLDQPQMHTKARRVLGPIEPGTDSARGEGNFYALAHVPGEGVFVTANGDDTKGWVLKFDYDKRKGPSNLRPYLATKVATGVDAPVGITVSPKNELVVGQMGEMNVAGDSLLTFYDAKTKKLKAKYTTGLHDIAGLAYSPKTGKLYAVDFAWVDVSKGGLFELSIADGKVTATKIASIMKPTALAFDANGTLYVTSFGSAEDLSSMTGEVLKFEPGL